MHSRVRVWLPILLSLLIALAGCGTSAGAKPAGGTGGSPAASGGQKYRISIATGNQGAVYYALGAGLVSLLNKYSTKVQATAEATSGANENERLVGQGEVQIGFGTPAADVPAYKGLKPFDKAYTNLRGVVGGYMQLGLFIVRADSGIKTLADIKGKKVAMPTGGIATFVLIDVLKAAGLEKDKDYTLVPLGYAEQVDALANRQIDVSTQFAGQPIPSVTQMTATMKIRILQPDRKALEAAVKNWYGAVVTIPPGTYKGIDEPIVSPGIAATLITNASVPDEVIDEVLKIVTEHNAEWVQVHPAAAGFSKENAKYGGEIPWHPAAEKFLKRVGWLS